MKEFYRIPIEEEDGASFYVQRRHVLGVLENADGSIVVYVQSIAQSFTIHDRTKAQLFLAWLMGRTHL